MVAAAARLGSVGHGRREWDAVLAALQPMLPFCDINITHNYHPVPKNVRLVPVFPTDAALSQPSSNRDGTLPVVTTLGLDHRPLLTSSSGSTTMGSSVPASCGGTAAGRPAHGHMGDGDAGAVVPHLDDVDMLALPMTGPAERGDVTRQL